MQNFLSHYSNDKNSNNSSNTEKVEEGKESKQDKYLFDTKKVFSLCPINNPSTFRKDVEIIRLYGGAFINYLSSHTAKTLPMFTYPPSPVAVKEIVLDTDISVEAGESTIVSFAPFAPRIAIRVLKGDTNTTTPIPVNATNAFSYYQVVMAQLMIKQVGILSVNDGYGTIMDGVVTSATQPDHLIKNNFLSIQVSGGKRVMGVDGREGVTVTLIGSPEYHKIYKDGTGEVNTIVPYGDTYIPAGSFMGAFYNLNEQRTTLIPMAGGANHTLGPWTVETADKDYSGVRNTSIMVGFPEGEKAFIRVSPPAINVALKMYTRIIVQGPLVPEFALDVPTFTPQRPFDFGRVKLALDNTVPSIGSCPDIEGSCKELQHQVTQISYAAANLVFPYRPKKTGDGFKRFYPEEHIDELTKKLYRASLYDKVLASEDAGIIIQQAAPVKLKADKARSLLLPDILKDALLFSHQLVTKVKSTASSNRLFRDATTALPSSTYQYFPVISGDGDAVPSIVIVNVGVLGGNKTKKYSITDLERNKKTISISYSSKDFTENGLKEFEIALGVIVSYLWGSNYHSTINTEFTVRFFSPAPLEQTSYMLALTAALYGLPSGSYCTGSFEKVKTYFVPKNMDEDIVKKKVKSATIDYPLLILTPEGPEGAGINVLSGVVPLYADGAMIPTFSLDMAMTYLATPFKIRKVNRTPYYQYNEDAQNFLLSNPIPEIRQYIILYNAGKEKIDNFITTQKFSIKDFVKSDPSNFVNYYTKKNRYVTTNGFFGKHPTLLNEPNFWYFKIGQDIFVDNAAFINLVNSTGDIKKGDMYTEAIGLNLESTKKEDIESITKDDVKSLLDKKTSEVARNPIAYRIPVEKVYKLDDDQMSAKDRLKELSKMVGGYIERLEELKEYMAKNGSTGKNTVAITPNMTLNNALANLKIGNRVKKEFNIKQIPFLAFFEELSNTLDVGGILTIALAGKWPEFQAEPKPQSKDIKLVIDYVTKHPIAIKKEKEKKEEEVEEVKNLRVLYKGYAPKKEKEKKEESKEKSKKKKKVPKGKEPTESDIDAIIEENIQLSDGDE